MLDLQLKRTEIGLTDMHAKGGLIGNLNKVSSEFIQQENLYPMKILITGPPCSGKSALADHLGYQYLLPVIRVADLLAASDHLQPQDASAVAQALKGGKANSGRVPPELMAKLGRHVLSRVPMKNRGYILDGFPKTLREARELFTDPREWSPAEIEENLAIEAALGSKISAGAGVKGAKAGELETKKGGARGLAKSIDDVADPRKTCDTLMPNVLVFHHECSESLRIGHA